MKCEWCGIPLTNKNLFSTTGYQEFVGPICRTCVKVLKIRKNGSVDEQRAIEEVLKERRRILLEEKKERVLDE